MEEDTGTFARDRPDGVNKKRLPELNLETKIPIYHKTSARSSNSLIISAFPKEALTLFSKAALDYVRKAQDNGSKVDLYQIQGGDVDSLKLIFKWVQDCIDQQSITKFPDIEEPEKDPFAPTLKVIDAAELMKVPAGSLQFFLEKRLLNIARKHMMGLDQVRKIYLDETKIYEGAPLSRIACSSIFNAWWDHRLDKNPKLMEELADLREVLPKLDEDLHQACVDKEDEVNRKKAEKEESKRKAMMTSVDDHDDAGWEGNNVTDATNETDEWTNSAGFVDGNASTWDDTADWNKENTLTTNGGIDWSMPTSQTVTGPEQGDQENGNIDWAEESAAHAVANPQLSTTSSVSGGNDGGFW